MNYDLAKRLKDAGFRNDYWEPSIEAEQPTLSELIEACGDSFDRLMLRNGEWGAYATANHYRIPGFILHWCSTPEEAVANLWLALNKKHG